MIIDRALSSTNLHAEQGVWWAHGLPIRYLAVSFLQQLGARSSSGNAGQDVQVPANYRARMCKNPGEGTAGLAETMEVGNGRARFLEALS